MEDIILTFDQGNSCAKLTVFACLEGERHRVVESRRYDTTPSVEEVAALIEELNVSGGIYCTVGHLDVRFVETLRGLLDGKLLLFTHSTPLPIEIDYASAATLGLDRIAAAVGAMQIVPDKDAVVIDAGTAITEDLVTHASASVPMFRGGRISPGLRIRFRALHSFTSALPEVNPSGECPVVGKTTEESIRAGVVRGLVSEIEGVCKEYLDIGGSTDIAILLTGGDAAFIAGHLRQQVRIEPNLNEIGLCAIYLYNQSSKFA